MTHWTQSETTEAQCCHMWKKNDLVRTTYYLVRTTYKSYVRLIISYVRLIISYVRLIMSYVRLIISYARLIILYVRLIISYVRLIISYVQLIMSYVRLIISTYDLLSRTYDFSSIYMLLAWCIDSWIMSEVTQQFGVDVALFLIMEVERKHVSCGYRRQCVSTIISKNI